LDCPPRERPDRGAGGVSRSGRTDRGCLDRLPRVARHRATVPPVSGGETAALFDARRAPGSRVVYLTSRPILPRVVDDWFDLVRGLDTEEARQRLFLVSPVDGAPRSLTESSSTVRGC